MCFMNVCDIEEKIVSYYKNLYEEEMVERPFPEGLEWDSILEIEASWLERPFEIEEIKTAVFEMADDKAPGPDGFSMGFFQECWDVVREDLRRVFEEFYNYGVIGKSMNSNFISLIPKKEKCTTVGDFRPISLSTSVYKIVAKVLSKRLSLILSKTISKEQHAFVEGRQNLDACLVANEVMEDVRRDRKKGVILN